MEHHKVTVYEKIEYDMIAAPSSFFFGFFRKPVLIPSPVRLNCGENLLPGNEIIRIGKAGSAGYPDFNIEKDGQFLWYMGMFENLEGKLVLFDVLDSLDEKLL